MNGIEALVFVVLVAVVGVVAYALGARRGASGAASTSQPKAPTPPSKKEKEANANAADENAEPAADEPAPAEPAATEPAKRDEGAPAEDAPAPAAAAESKSDAPSAEAPPPEDDMPKLWVEDDDEIDPTRVGALPAIARKVLQPPVELVIVDEGAADDEDAASAASAPLLLITASAQTDTGLRRKRNEDSLVVNVEANLFVVADGMGGHRGGELASKLAVKALEEAFVTGTIEGTPHASLPADASEIARALQMANATILETAEHRRDLEGMGTTVCAARFTSSRRRMWIAHVGDSRCYRLRDGVFTQLTNDHTMAEHGVTGPESLQLSRAVGVWATIPVDVLAVMPRPGDVYLLCSDGLTKMLTDDIIGNVLRGEEDMKAAVERLILFANARGGKDNITVILVRVSSTAAEPSS